MGRGVRRALGGTVAAAMVVMAWSSSASAHVTIDTLGTVSKGSFAKLGFSVPNERDDAATVKLSVQLPADHPIPFVSVQPVPGWDVTTTTRTLDEPIEGEGSSITEVVDTITWTATDDVGIQPGQFELFWISAGPLPSDVDAVTFPAVQTYSSGEEVAWIEASEPGAAEPELPAPVVELADAADDATTVADDDGTDALTVVALVVAVLGLLAGVAALVLARRPRPSGA